MKRKSFLKTIGGLIASPYIIKEAIKDKEQWKKANPVLIDEMHDHEPATDDEYLFTDENVSDYTFIAIPFHDGYDEHGMTFGQVYESISLVYNGDFNKVFEKYKNLSKVKFLLGKRKGEGVITLLNHEPVSYTHENWKIYVEIEINKIHLL